MTKRVFYSIVTLTLLVLVVLTGWHYLGTTSNSSSVTLVVPQQLGGLPREQLISGPQAISEISQMHRKQLSLAEGHIAKYSAGGKEITLWLSVSSSSEEGAALFRDMDAKMPASRVFTNRQTFKVKQVDIISVRGMGQNHYYWVQGKDNYWVATNVPDVIPVLEELITIK